MGALGCCVGPPEIGLSDVGRIVSLGGRDWILAEILAGNLLPGAAGLSIKRVRRRERPDVSRGPKCVYHGLQGCTISPDRRSATCNYFLCGDAYAEGGEAQGHPDASRGRALHAALRELYTRWDHDLAARRAELWPEVVWDAALLDWLGREVEALAAGVSAEILPFPVEVGRNGRGAD